MDLTALWPQNFSVWCPVSTFRQMHSSCRGISLQEYRREEWHFLWIPVEVWMDEVVVSLEMLL